MQGGSMDDGERSQCAGLELLTWLASAREALDAFVPEDASSHAELFLGAERRLSLEHDASTGVSTLNLGESAEATARVGGSTRQGVLTVPMDDVGGLPRLLDQSSRLATPGRALVLPHLPAVDVQPPTGPAALQPEAARRRMADVIHSVIPQGSVVQAAVLTQSSTWRAVVRATGVHRARTEWREDLFVRCETPRGAVVDAVSLPPGADDTVFTPLRLRLAEAVDALTGTVEAVDRSLPLVLRPAVAAPPRRGARLAVTR